MPMRPKVSREGQLPEIHSDHRASHAYLGFVCSGPSSCDDGEWVLLLEDADGLTLSFTPIALAFDSEDAPILFIEQALKQAGYTYSRFVVGIPWAAEWMVQAPA